ncbi:hypothetical protein CPB97_003498 [Podila verticillata]|nr:hypothetical protein CPB97_003498 [Podila verticillata]
MAIIRRCVHKYNDENDDSSSVCEFKCANKSVDLRDDINEMKYKESLFRKSLKQILKSKKQEKDTRTVVVKNLHPTTTVDDLKWAFKDFGRIYSATVSCTFGSKHSRGNGHAFLEFRDIETMVQATNMNGAIVQSRAIRVAPKNTNTVDIVKGSHRHGHRYGQRQGYGQGFWAGKTSGHGYGRAFARAILDVEQECHGHSTLRQGP